MGAMFPGHPYVRQEARRAEQEGERKERERVLRLIESYDRLNSPHGEEARDLLDYLSNAVRRGHQR